MHFISDNNAKGVLRGLIRSLEEQTPSKEKLIARVRTIVKGSKNSLRAVNRIREYVKPFSLNTIIGQASNCKLGQGYCICATVAIFDQATHQITIDILNVICITSGYLDITYSGTAIKISGHALERLFQRANVISVEKILEQLRLATIFQPYWDTAIVSGKQPLQFLLPAHGGIFLGTINYGQRGPENNLDHKLIVRTFILDGKEHFDKVKEQLAYSQHLLQTHHRGAMSMEYAKAARVFSIKAMEHILESNPWLNTPYMQELEVE
jgi:hypothetical protein